MPRLLRRLGALAACAGLALLSGPATGAPARTGRTTPRTPTAWVQRALESQYHLGDALPMLSAPWIGTHNSFNSEAEVGPALSPMDSNQHLTLTAQLDSGVRQLEIDVHWFPSVRGDVLPTARRALQGNPDQPVVCHALPNHAGCTTEKTLGPVLDEIGTWLRAHPRQVLLLYLEDHLDNQTGYQTAGRLITSKLGTLVYRTHTPGSCSALPLRTSRDDVRRAGAQVVVVANSCGVGNDPAWRADAFDWSPDHVEAQPEHGFQGWPKCGPDFTERQYRTEFTRYFEEMGKVSTLDNAGGWPITAADATGMTRCGVDLISLDQWSPTDPRLAALVWSWAPGQPAAGRGCAVQRPDGRWVSRACGQHHRVACRTAHGGWRISPHAVLGSHAARACRVAGATYAPPRSGHENQLLLSRHRAAGTRHRLIWIEARAG